MSYLLFGVLATVLGVIGAVLAAHALDVGMLTFGFGLLAFAIVLVFWLIKDRFDEQERSPS